MSNRSEADPTPAGPGGLPPQYQQPSGSQPGGQPPYHPAYHQPPGQPAYGQPTYQPPGAPGFRVGEAIGYGWSKVTGNFGPWVLFMLICVAVSWAFSGLMRVPAALLDQGTRLGSWSVASPRGVDASFGGTVIGVLGTILAMIAAAMMARGALEETRGRPPALSGFFRFANVGAVLLTAAVLGLALELGYTLCFLPGLLVLVFTVFALYFLADRSQGTWESIRLSMTLAAQNFGSVLLLLFTLFGVNILGALACGLGLFVTLPVTHVAIAFAYRRLLGQPVY